VCKGWKRFEQTWVKSGVRIRRVLTRRGKQQQQQQQKKKKKKRMANSVLKNLLEALFFSLQSVGIEQRTHLHRSHFGNALDVGILLPTSDSSAIMKAAIFAVPTGLR
jgi:hypothetical protein